MHGSMSMVDRVSHFIHQRFLWLLLATYVVAAFWPGPGLWLREVSLGTFSVLGNSTHVTVPVLMLAFLLLNSGLGVRTDQLRNMLRSPLVLGAGLLANLLLPILYIVGVSLGLRFWHNPDEVQNILVGLALIASMPIAGSSTAWAQNANGNMALSLGLVLGSTFLSPVTTPVALHAVGFLAEGDYAEDLHELAASGTGGFLMVSVILPSILGVGLKLAAGERRISAIKPRLRLVNSVILLVLNYSNAAISLPKAIANPDWDFLTAILVIAAGLCAFAFTSGWAVARLLKVDRSEKSSLMFGLGMNNNGTGLVLASLMLADHPQVLIPIIFYNLVQHLVAGMANAALDRSDRRLLDPEPNEPTESPQEVPFRHESSSGPERPRLGVEPPA